MKTQTTIRVDETNYIKARQILKILGLSYSQAISLFNSMIVLNNGLPFDAKIPNKKTLKAISELKEKQGKTFSNVDDLFQDLES
ncbi:MAG: type II toxin-antitoxin system RelB/DinJ family antitoxin [Candidatus Cloacimonetes bacterium]|nr:type II toxin-antitoxin system RelB/DinJ family antitoxin [Candidatus Cloacimonadota bacterium]